MRGSSRVIWGSEAEQGPCNLAQAQELLTRHLTREWWMPSSPLPCSSLGAEAGEGVPQHGGHTGRDVVSDVTLPHERANSQLLWGLLRPPQTGEAHGGGSQEGQEQKASQGGQHSSYDDHASTAAPRPGVDGAWGPALSEGDGIGPPRLGPRGVHGIHQEELDSVRSWAGEGSIAVRRQLGILRAVGIIAHP